ncbi:FecR family protein [Pontibacter locisalis]|uniref:FecR family protein n=1 Tax=Pontibacter locisalis TaxID=1719035 RepID=A0ABW5ILN9_9BACT
MCETAPPAMDSKYWDIAAKTFEGKATPTEQEVLLQWLEQHPEHMDEYKAQKQLWKMTAPAQTLTVDTDAAWQKVHAKLEHTHHQDKKVIPLYRQLWQVAAAAVLVIGIAWLAKLYFLPYYGMQVVESGNKDIAVWLPDSSRVWLNKSSLLAYDPDFDGPQRDVRLEGEAFFEVTHNPQKPFVIEAEAAKTLVLGTSFNLRAYPLEETVELTVATGKVAFSAAGAEQAIVTPGFGVTFLKQDKRIVKYDAPDENAWAWKTQKLQFKGKSLRDVLTELERYYGARMLLQQPDLASCRFTGTFQGSSLEEVLQVLEASLQIEISKQNEHTYIIVTGEGCK